MRQVKNHLLTGLVSAILSLFLIIVSSTASAAIEQDNQPTIMENKTIYNPLDFDNLNLGSPIQSKTVYVAGNGSGDFNCDGVDDQVEINRALKYVSENPYLTTVYFKGPFTYVISDSILIGNNTTLEGDSTAVVKLEDNANWPVGKPMITQMNSTGIHEVTIEGFEIDGNHDNNLDKPTGYGFYNMIYFSNSTDIKVHDMYMHDGHGEGLKVDRSYNVQFYNNVIYKMGHNAFFAEDCQNLEAWNNKITIRTDCGLRVLNSNHIRFHDNVIDSFYHWSGGDSGIMVEKTTGTVNDVEIYNNIIHDIYGSGIWLIGWLESYPREEAQNVHVFRNIFYNTGMNPNNNCVGGIITSGFYDTLIENNVFDEVYHAAIIHMSPIGIQTYPTYETRSSLSPARTEHTTIVRKNIIVNTQKRKIDPDGTGYAIINYLPETDAFVLENNCLYNNSAGNYQNCTSSTDTYADPLFVNRSIHNYHLEPDSPCIGAGCT